MLKPQHNTLGKAEQNQRPTLKTIAYMSGLAVTTVSRALKDAPDIGEDTKRRVRLIAKQIGYRPNRAGVRLRTGKTNVISLILNTDDEFTHLASHMISGISEVITDTPYHLVVTPYSHDSDPMDPVRYVVETGSADGIILSRTEPDDPRVRYLIEHGFPFATHGRTDLGVDHAYHDFDNFAFARDAVDILVDLGCQRIGLLGPSRNLSFASHMTEGFLAGAAERGVGRVPITSITIDDPIQTIADGISDMMAKSDRPDGIVCGSAGAAIGATAGIEQAGMLIGPDIALVSKQSSLDILQWFRSDIQVINEDFRLAGRQLAGAVMALIGGADPKDHQILVYGVAPQ